MEVIKTNKYRLAIDGHVLLQKEKTGVGQTAQHLIDELVKNSAFDIQINFVDFLGYRCRKLIRHYKRQGCRVRFCWWLPYSVYIKIIEKYRIPYSILFGKRNDITLFFEYRVPFGVGTRVANYVYDVNYIVYPETVDETVLQWLNKYLPIYCERSDMIITISEFSKKEIEKYLGVSGDRIRVVPCGVDCEQYNREAGMNRIGTVREKYGIEGKYILYMGTLEPRKNIALLIEAYHKLLKTASNLPKLVIAGKKGWMFEQLFQMVSEFGLEEQVLFTGYIEDNEKAALLAGAELFVFPSLYEGFGIPPLEAMACGTSVIVSNVDALLEAVGECAAVFCSGDAVDLGSKMRQLLDNKEERERMSEAGISWAKGHTWELAGMRLATILEAV